MSYGFDPLHAYRMPTHFGAALGPRQQPGGGPYPLDQGQRATMIWASFAARRDEIATLLPPGFDPAEQADLTVDIKTMTNIGWLAGRGYNVVTVTTGVVWTGGGKRQAGRFKLVLWENRADPIITGREDLGYPKLYADITDVADPVDASAAARASWDGFVFLDLAVEGLCTSDDAAPPGGSSYHLYYMPRIGRSTHGSAQVIHTPPGQGALTVVRRQAGRGRAEFHAGRWEQLPTLAPVVNRLAALELGACLGAGCLMTAGTTDLRHQEIVAELPQPDAGGAA